jgi:hypothetical protein
MLPAPKIVALGSFRDTVLGLISRLAVALARVDARQKLFSARGLREPTGAKKAATERSLKIAGKLR